MQIYFFTAGVESDELNDLENRIRASAARAAKADEIGGGHQAHRAADDRAGPEVTYIIFPVLTDGFVV